MTDLSRRRRRDDGRGAGPGLPGGQAAGAGTRVLRPGRRRERVELRRVPGGVRATGSSPGRRAPGSGARPAPTAASTCWPGPRSACRYREGLVPAIEFDDVSKVTSVSAAHVREAGCYRHVLVVDETSPNDPASGHQIKYYAPGTGLVRVAASGGDTQEFLTLAAVRHLDEARDGANGAPRRWPWTAARYRVAAKVYRVDRARRAAGRARERHGQRARSSPERVADQLRPVPHAGLGQQVVDVRLHRRGGDAELGRRSRRWKGRPRSRSSTSASRWVSPAARPGAGRRGPRLRRPPRFRSLRHRPRSRRPGRRGALRDGVHQPALHGRVQLGVPRADRRRPPGESPRRWRPS